MTFSSHFFGNLKSIFQKIEQLSENWASRRKVLGVSEISPKIAQIAQIEQNPTSISDAQFEKITHDLEFYNIFLCS